MGTILVLPSHTLRFKQCRENAAAAERPKPDCRGFLHRGADSHGVVPEEGIECRDVDVIADFKHHARLDVVLEILADMGVVLYHVDSQLLEEVPVADGR